MAETLKNLGQADLTSTSLSAVYTVPSATSAALSTIAVTNRHTSLSCTFDLAHSPAGASISNAHYFAMGETLAASTSVYLTLGITMATTDVLMARAGTANQLSVNVWGVEKT